MTCSRASLDTETLPAAIESVQRDLQTSANEIALSLSLFILVQGISPLLWSSLSDIKGRKLIYISSMLVRASFGQQTSDADEFQIFVIGSIFGGLSQSIGVLICMRMLQAVGSSAVSAIGSGTLAVRDPFGHQAHCPDNPP